MFNDITFKISHYCTKKLLKSIGINRASKEVHTYLTEYVIEFWTPVAKRIVELLEEQKKKTISNEILTKSLTTESESWRFGKIPSFDNNYTTPLKHHSSLIKDLCNIPKIRLSKHTGHSIKCITEMILLELLRKARIYLSGTGRVTMRRRDLEQTVSILKEE